MMPDIHEGHHVATFSCRLRRGIEIGDHRLYPARVIILESTKSRGVTRQALNINIYAELRSLCNEGFNYTWCTQVLYRTAPSLSQYREDLTTTPVSEQRPRKLNLSDFSKLASFDV